MTALPPKSPWKLGTFGIQKASIYRAQSLIAVNRFSTRVRIVGGAVHWLKASFDLNPGLIDSEHLELVHLIPELRGVRETRGIPSFVEVKVPVEPQNHKIVMSEMLASIDHSDAVDDVVEDSIVQDVRLQELKVHIELGVGFSGQD